MMYFAYKYRLHCSWILLTLTPHPCLLYTDSCFHIKTRLLYCVECPQCGIRLNAVCYLCTSCLLLHLTIPIVVYLWLI